MDNQLPPEELYNKIREGIIREENSYFSDLFKSQLGTGKMVITPQNSDSTLEDFTEFMDGLSDKISANNAQVYPDVLNYYIYSMNKQDYRLDLLVRGSFGYLIMDQAIEQ